VTILSPPATRVGLHRLARAQGPCHSIPCLARVRGRPGPVAWGIA
jgi:hypothetical protein